MPPLEAGGAGQNGPLVGDPKMGTRARQTRQSARHPGVVLICHQHHNTSSVSSDGALSPSLLKHLLEVEEGAADCSHLSPIPQHF